MATRQIKVERFCVISSRAFPEVLATLEAAVGHPDMAKFAEDAANARTYAELQVVVHKAVGPSGLMEFMRFNLGEILRKRMETGAPRMVRLVIGNPLIMSRMAEHVPDAGSYAPITVLIDERRDGVHLSYDCMASFLAPYGNSEALQVAGELDWKVETLLAAAAGEKRPSAPESAA